MGLRITVMNPDTLSKTVKAVAAAAAATSEVVILIWTPDYFAVQSMIPAELPRRKSSTALLKIAASSDGFISYDSTDGYFNAVVDAAALEAVFSTAENSEPIEFLQSLEDDNGVNEFGFLHARFNRPVGANMEEYISLKIHGILPHEMLQSADVSVDPSLNPLPPVATFRAHEFSVVVAAMEAFSHSVKVTVTKNKVSFLRKGEVIDPLHVTPEIGLISTRDDPVEFEFHLPFEDIQSGADMSDVVHLFRRAEDVVVLQFTLASKLLHGDIIYWT